MVKPGPTDTLDLSNNLATLRHAEAIVQDVIDGKALAPETIVEARETFVGMLWNSQPATEGPSRYGLFVLYVKARDPADKAELIGELFAAGRRGQSILDEIARADSSTKLTADELTTFKDNIDLPLQERLQLVLDKLSEEAARSGGSNDSNVPDNRHPFPSEKPILPTRGGILKEEEISDPGDGPPDDPEASNAQARESLADTSRSPEERHRAAVWLGRKAVPLLSKMLLSKSHDQREIAAAALVCLGKTKEAGRSVHEAMTRLETQIETRHTAEFVRKTMESENLGANHDPLARERARGAGIPDGWLRRAFAACDSPNILKAAAGREALAIPIAIRLLHEMRAGRANLISD